MELFLGYLLATLFSVPAVILGLAALRSVLYRPSPNQPTWGHAFISALTGFVAFWMFTHPSIFG